MLLLGELAALGTSVCWSFTSVFFTLAGRVVGSIVVNRVRLLMAVGFLMLTHLVLYGQLLPLGAAPERWFWLSLSGVIGLVIGDIFLFQAFVWIGPRISMLIMTLSPVISTVLAWVFLGEILSVLQLLAVAITVGGGAWVILDRTDTGSVFHAERGYKVGILFALAGATGQSIGLVTAKKGLAGDFSALSGTLMRMIAAAIVLWIITIFQRQVRTTFGRMRANPRAFLNTLGGAFFGPFLGVTLSLVAVQATEVGVASTLMSLAPIMLLPISRFIFGESISWRAILGTFIAIGGVTLLLFADS